jgi:osmotically-inducible protein OsmY
MDDLSLRQNILDELEWEPSVDAANIGVAVKNGVATLTGHVSSFPQKLTVERLVGRIKGVKGYAEEIEVRLPGTVAASDDEIAQRAVNSLRWSTVVPDGKVQVKVQNGWITLTGALDWNYQKLGASDAVRNLEGVIGVSNLIELKSRVSSIDVRKHIQDALNRSAQLEASAIHVDVSGNKVTLAGNVKAWFERGIAERAAWATPGVTAVEDRLTIS